VTPENYLLAVTEAPTVFYDDMMKIYESRNISIQEEPVL
jgi:hypothetical protein